MISVTRVATKRLLVDISHAIEQFALADDDGPTVVIAMFQRLSYFEREVETYRRIAATGAVCLVGIVEDLPPALAPGIRHVLLGAHEPLAREWSVTVLTPSTGATLVVNDTEKIAADSATLEAGREFVGGWSFRREDAYAEVMRLRAALGTRMGANARKAIEDVLWRVVSAPGDPTEARSSAALEHLIEVADSAGARGGALQRKQDEQTLTGPERDARTGLHNERYLARWLAGSAGGTLPLGVVLMHVAGLGELRQRFGARAEIAAARTAGDVLRAQLGASDRLVSLGGNAFLALLPSAQEAELQRFHTAGAAALAQAEQRYPFVPLAMSAVATVTRDRPLPVPGLERTIAGMDGREALVLSS